MNGTLHTEEGRIQVSSLGGVGQPYILPTFPKNPTKIKKFLSVGGGTKIFLGRYFTAQTCGLQNVCDVVNYFFLFYLFATWNYFNS